MAGSVTWSRAGHRCRGSVVQRLSDGSAWCRATHVRAGRPCAELPYESSMRVASERLDVVVKRRPLAPALAVRPAVEPSGELAGAPGACDDGRRVGVSRGRVRAAMAEEAPMRDSAVGVLDGSHARSRGYHGP